MAARILCSIGFLFVVACVTPAAAHEWYEAACCSGHDCAPIAFSRVQVNSAGFLIDGKFSVPFKDVRRSMDGSYHACFPNPETLRCFYAPAGS